jgi:hypothetical protein
MSNEYPPPGSGGQDPGNENPPPPPSEPQWNPQSPGTPQVGGGDPGYGQPGYEQPGYGQQPYQPYQQPSYPPPPPGGYGAGPGGPGGYGGYGQPVQTSPLAIVSLVLGIVGFLCCTFFVLGIGAAVTGFLARKQINESQGRLKGAGMALAGLILGIASIVIALIYWVLVLSGALDSNFNFETS